jgi:hypothetical protein
VRFEPIDRYLDWISNLSPEDMAPRKSKDILEAMEQEAALKKEGQRNKAGRRRQRATSKTTASDVRVSTGTQQTAQLRFPFMHIRLATNQEINEGRNKQDSPIEKEKKETTQPPTFIHGTDKAA